MCLRMLLSAWLAGALLPAQLPKTTTAPSTRPAGRRWGPAAAGASVAVAAMGRWRFAGPLKLDFAIRNTGSAAATLPRPDRFFGYLLLAQGKRAYYTEKILHAENLAGWPEKLPRGRTLSLPAVDVRKLRAFAYKRGMKLIGGYPAQIVAGRPRRPEAIGTFAELLQPGPVKIRYVAYLDRPREGPLQLASPAIKIEIRISDFERLPLKARRRVLDALAARMNRDAWSAKVAHGDAVRIGPPAIPTLRRIVKETRSKFFARMWAVTALADIGSAGVVGTLIECLTDPTPGVRHAAAYHGLKVKDAGFDKALTDRALSGKDPMVTAWTIMGYLKFRGAVPPELLKAGVKSGQWRVRAAVAETIARGAPDRSHVPILRRLVLDENAMIRATAARALRYVGDRSRRTIGALVKSLQLRGESARHAAAAALCALTGRNWPYQLTASAEERRAVLRKWRSWWDQNKSK